MVIMENKKYINMEWDLETWWFDRKIIKGGVYWGEKEKKYISRYKFGFDSFIKSAWEEIRI